MDNVRVVPLLRLLACSAHATGLFSFCCAEESLRHIGGHLKSLFGRAAVNDHGMGDPSAVNERTKPPEHRSVSLRKLHVLLLSQEGR